MRLPKAEALKAELDAVASVELGDVLDSWDDGTLSLGQARRLKGYLVSEMGSWGMLSVEKARDCGATIGRERVEARKVIRAIEKAEEAV